MNNGKQKNIYLATSIVFDEEMRTKVEVHKERRQDKWVTVEGYKDFSKCLEGTFTEGKSQEGEDAGKSGTGNNILVDCLTNMVSNIILENRDINWDAPTKEQMRECDEMVKRQVEELLGISNKFENMIIVSNELGMGIVPAYPLGRYFREIAGKMNQLVAEKSDEAYLVVSGMPMKLK